MKKKYLEKSMLFNKDSINVFTDASMDSSGNNGCAGAVLVDENYKVIKYTDVILNNITVNRAELIGIKLGITEGLKTKRKNINIFSDSLLSVNSLRTWIFKWAKNSRNDILINSSKKPVVNMDIMCDIVNLINQNSDVNINIFHQRGHISLKEANKVKSLFRRINDGYIIDMDMVKILKCYNDMVDNNTRNHLNIKFQTNREPVAHRRLFINNKNIKNQVNRYKSLSLISLK